MSWLTLCFKFWNDQPSGSGESETTNLFLQNIFSKGSDWMPTEAVTPSEQTTSLWPVFPTKQKTPHLHSSRRHCRQLKICIQLIDGFISIALNCSVKYKLYIFIMKGKFNFLNKTPKILLYKGQFQKNETELDVCQKRHGINLKCVTALILQRFMTSFKKFRTCEEASWNPARHTHICRKRSYITYQMKSNVRHIWY